MEEYTYTPIDVVIHWYTRFRSWLVSKRDNRALYKQFSTELHLDKLEKEDISYVLPETYLIVTNEIKQLYNVRDEILIKMHHKDYVKKQAAIDDKLKELESEHELLKTHRTEERVNYDKLRNKLKNIKNSEDHIALESRVSQAHTKLINTDAAIKNNEKRVSELIHAKKLNYDNWGKQIKLVEKVIDDAIVKYIKRSTKKIELSYGFTAFTYETADYDDEMKKIVKGEY